MTDNAAVVYTARDDLSTAGAGTLKVMLLSSAATLDLGAEFAADVASLETTGFAGYARQTIASTAYDATTGVLSGDDVTFASLGTAGDFVGGAAVIRWVSTDANSPVVCIAAFDPDRECDGGDFDIQFGGVIASHDAYDPDVVQARQTTTGANSWDDSQYWVDRACTHLAGTINGGASGAALGTLPAPARPAVALALPVWVTDGADARGWGELAISTAGVMTPTYPTGLGTLVLDSVPAFRVA